LSLDSSTGAISGTPTAISKLGILHRHCEQHRW
jgi:hypothetical protein